MPDHNASTIQLAIIEELTSLLKQVGIAHWLFGGWAVDFLVGAVTRPHEDIDLIIWREDAPAVREILASQGYAEAPPAPEESALHTHFSKQNQLIDAIFIYRVADGGVYWSDARWPDDSFTSLQGRLGEVVCPVSSARSLIDSKEAYLRDSPDQSDREKYLLDIATLRPLLGDG